MNKNIQEKRVVLSLDHVGVAYRRKSGFLRKEKFWALKDVSFDIFHGETLGVIGRNGVGKSTLLRLLAGIISPDKGKVINHGVTASLLSLQAGFIGHLTGRENAILSGMMLGLPKKSVLARMDEIEAYADIGSHFDQPVHNYSSGMRARVGFSVAVYVNPDVILLDEVLGVGDADFRKKSSESLKKKIKSRKTVVIVSHNLEMIEKVCDRIVLLKNGISQESTDTDMIIQEYLGL